MKRLLQDRLIRGIGLSIFLCILIFAGVIGYQRWHFVQRAYAEAARFGYTEENFLVAEEHCGDPWILFIPPQTCYLTIYFTTDMNREQLVQFMLEKRYFSSYARSGSPVTAQTLMYNIKAYGKGNVAIAPISSGERWGFIDRDHLSISFWPNLTYTVDEKIFRQNVIGVGTRR